MFFSVTVTKVAEGQHLRLWSLGYVCFNLLGSEPILLSLRTQTYFRLLREVTAGNTLHPVVLHILTRVRTDIGFCRLSQIVAYIIAQAYLYRGKRADNLRFNSSCSHRYPGHTPGKSGPLAQGWGIYPSRNFSRRRGKSK